MKISLCSEDPQFLLKLEQPASGLGRSFRSLLCLSLKALHLGNQSVAFFFGPGLFCLLALLQDLNPGLQITPFFGQCPAVFS